MRSCQDLSVFLHFKHLTIFYYSLFVFCGFNLFVLLVFSSDDKPKCFCCTVLFDLNKIQDIINLSQRRYQEGRITIFS